MTVAWPPPGAITVTQATRALVMFSLAARPEHLGTRRRRDLAGSLNRYLAVSATGGECLGNARALARQQID